jgi:Flp pilus assembly protein TadD
LLGALGCGTTGIEFRSVEEIEDELRARGIDAPIIPFQPTATMQEWVQGIVPRGHERVSKLDILAHALLADNELAIDYHRDVTATAPEVFATREANCLSFTHLFVGLAREVGVPVYFLEVRDLERYQREGDLIVHSDHIAVGYGPAHELTVIDFAVEQGTNYHKIRPISDVSAIALFYSNRGADHLRKGDLATAREWFAQAVTIDPSVSSAWINYGVALRRSGEPERAESAYRRALELDATQFSAYHNLATLLRLRGQEQEALDLLSLANRGQNRNPFLYVSLGDLSLRYGRVAEAERFYRRAVRLGQESAEPLAALGLLHAQEGQIVEARRMLRRARRLDPMDARVTLLERRLDLLPGT